MYHWYYLLRHRRNFPDDAAEDGLIAWRGPGWGVGLSWRDRALMSVLGFIEFFPTGIAAAFALLDESFSIYERAVVFVLGLFISWELCIYFRHMFPKQPVSLKPENVKTDAGEE